MKEGLYFYYDGKRSDDMGLINVQMDSGFFEEPFMSQREILETEVRGNHIPYFQEMKLHPITFSVTFAFEDQYDTQRIREVARWLSPDYYKPFYTTDNPNRIFYCMPEDDSQLMHNGLKQGYITLTMRCNSPYTYSPTYMSDWISFSNNPVTISYSTLTDFTDNSVKMLNLTGSNNQLHLDTDTYNFYRSSAKFDSGNIQYSTNEPVFTSTSFGQGLLIEKPQDNLFYGYADYSQNWTTNTNQDLTVNSNQTDSFGNTNATQILSQPATDVSSYISRDLFDVPVDTPFSIRMYIKNNSTQALTFTTMGGEIQHTFNSADGWVEVSHENLIFNSDNPISYVFESAQNELDFLIAYEQFELKPFLTSYIIDNRAGEYLDASLSHVNNDEGQIQFWFTPLNQSIGLQPLFYIQNANNDLYIYEDNGTVYLNFGDVVLSHNSINYNESHFIKVDWNYENQTITFQLDNSIKEDFYTESNKPEPLSYQGFLLGTDYNKANFAHGVFNGLKIKLNSDTNTSVPSSLGNIQEDTICKMDFNGNLNKGSFGRIEYDFSFTYDFNVQNHSCIMDSSISWTQPTDSASNIEVEVALSDLYREQSNGGQIAGAYKSFEGYGQTFTLQQILLTEDVSQNPFITDLTIEVTRGLIINNLGDTVLEPELWVNLPNGGDFSLINHANGDEIFSFEGLASDEEVYINNEHDHIITELDRTWRFDNFNDNFMELPLGTNYFTVEGDPDIRIRYEYKTLQG